MAIRMNTMDEGSGIEIIASGVVTGEEIIAAHRTIYSEENLKRQKYQLIDRTQCDEYVVTPGEIKIIAEIDKAASVVNPDITIVIVSPTELQFGMSRMWQAYVEEKIFRTRIFRDRKSADEWIREEMK